MSVASPAWVDGLTLAEVLSRTVQRWRDRPALIFPWLGYCRSYAEFHAEVRQAAAALLALGAQPGEHVGLWATSWPQWVVLQMATAQAGTVLVNINPAYRAQELAYVLNQADITTLFLTDQFKSTNYIDILEEVCPELMTTTGTVHAAACPRLRRVISIKSQPRHGLLSWDQFLQLGDSVAPEQLDRRQAAIRPDDIVNIQYTSGTTGFPKGAMLTHRNLLLNAYYVGQRQNMTEQDRLCVPVPFYHCFGCVLGSLLCIVHGTALVVPAEVFDPLATLQALQDAACTAVYGVPTMFIAELTHPRRAAFNLSSLRTGIMAGSPCPIEVMRVVTDQMGARELTIAYGLTEASPVVTQTQTTDSLEQRVATVGTPLPGLEVRLVQPGTVEPVPQGQPGELMVRGHAVMKGYYNKLKETADAITPDGWLHTGDLAQQMPDGYYRITGRIKDLIIRGGENVYPREVEEFLYTHPQIADVQVVGLPDATFGEEICAWIRLRPGARLSEDDVRCYCRRQIAHYKVPHYIVFVEEFPTTVTGKVQKFKLREMGIRRFGLEKAAAIETA
jgi:fatty-acyl-CoA synthase